MSKLTKVFDLQDRFAPGADVVAREVGGETILLDLGTGTYFGLNEVGGKLWQSLEAGQRSISELCDTVEQTFDAKRDIIERDVVALVQDLANRNLIILEST
ncbi:PqqD family protein [Erythrobacter alti]|uniref:PqqD family protein n=1 Tax=Erythrobacter alti TaxID=1896145 RepID=UPI0030F41955